MTFRKIPVNVPFWSNAEDESKVLVAEQRRDVIKDVFGTTIRRPALVQFASGLPQPADGMYYWETRDRVYIVSSGNLYSMTENGVISEVEAGIYGNGEHVSWAESADLTIVTEGATRKLFSTNGGRIVEFNGSTAQQLTGSDDPLESSHIIMFDTFLLSNELSNQKFDESILHSKVADPINFEGAFFSAENKSDPISALHSEWDEIAAFGTKALESFYNNGVDPFAQIPGATVKQGTLSPWTIKNLDNAYFMLNADRRLIRIDGRQATVLSQAIDDILSEAADAPNAEGEDVTFDGKTLYLLTINQRTFVFDYVLNEWVGEWGAWNTTTATYKPFSARNFINVKQWNKTFCASKTTGEIFELSSKAFRDVGDTIIRSSVITGNIDHGTGREKRSNELRFKLKRGNVEKLTVDQDQPLLLVRWRDNGSKIWSNYRNILLGFKGEDEFFWSLFQLGSYRSRQYEFVCTDDVPFSIVEVEEDVDLLR